MSKGRIELKVGLFVIVTLGLAAVMILKFSETGLGFRDTIAVTLHAKNAGTVVRESPVLMSGVKVGYVEDINLKESEGAVVVALTVHLYTEHANLVLNQNSTFNIKSSGFLGDQYIGVHPRPGPAVRAQLDQQGWLPCEAPFDIEEAGQKAMSQLEEVGHAVRAFRQIAENINTNLLSPETLDNMNSTIANFRASSDRLKVLLDENGTLIAGLNRSVDGMAEFSATAKGVAADVRLMLADYNGTIADSLANVRRGSLEFAASTAQIREAIRTNAPTVSASIGDFQRVSAQLRGSAEKFDKLIDANGPEVTKALANISAFTKKLDATTDELRATFTDNRDDITKIVKDMAAATDSIKGITASVNTIVTELEKGQGLAGALIKDEGARVQFLSIVTNLDLTAKQLSTLSSNLNASGLFWKPPKKPIVIPRTGPPRK